MENEWDYIERKLREASQNSDLDEVIRALGGIVRILRRHQERLDKDLPVIIVPVASE